MASKTPVAPATITKTAFAALVGVSQAAISIAIKAGRVAVTTDGRIDPEHPTNASYRSKRKSQRRRGQRTSGRSPGAIPTPTPEEPAPPSGPGPAPPLISPQSSAPGGNGHAKGRQESYDEADARWKRNQADKVEIDNRIKRGQFIERAVVDRFLKRRDSIDTSELRTLGDRLGAKLAGTARAAATDEQAAMDVNRALTDDVYRSLVHMQTLTDDFLAKGAMDDWEPADGDI